MGDPAGVLVTIPGHPFEGFDRLLRVEDYVTGEGSAASRRQAYKGAGLLGQRSPHAVAQVVVYFIHRVTPKGVWVANYPPEEEPPPPLLNAFGKPSLRLSACRMPPVFVVGNSRRFHRTFREAFRQAIHVRSFHVEMCQWRLREAAARLTAIRDLRDALRAQTDALAQEVADSVAAELGAP